MAPRAGWLWPALIIVAGASYQYLMHSAVIGGQIEPVRTALAFLPLLALACWIALRARHKILWTLVLLAAGCTIFALEQAHWGLVAATGIPHAAIYLSLLWLFGRTLRHGTEPLVTRFARHVHGTLSPGLAEYTRRVTCAWCVFFAAQIIISALLLGFASLSAWSLFINVLNFPLLALMFAGEYACRTLFHREFPPASFLDGIRAFSRDAAHLTSAKKQAT